MTDRAAHRLRRALVDLAAVGALDQETVFALRADLDCATDTGTVTSYTATGARRAAIPVASGAVTLTPGNDGRVYAGSVDGPQTVVMAVDGGLTLVRTMNRTLPSYQTPAPVAAISLPPATVVQPTTESIPPAHTTVTVDPTSATSGVGSSPGSATDPSATTTRKPTRTSAPPQPAPTRPPSRSG